MMAIPPSQSSHFGYLIVLSPCQIRRASGEKILGPPIKAAPLGLVMWYCYAFVIFTYEVVSNPIRTGRINKNSKGSLAIQLDDFTIMLPLAPMP